MIDSGMSSGGVALEIRGEDAVGLDHSAGPALGRDPDRRSWLILKSRRVLVGVEAGLEALARTDADLSRMTLRRRAPRRIVDVLEEDGADDLGPWRRSRTPGAMIESTTRQSVRTSSPGRRSRTREVGAGDEGRRILGLVGPDGPGRVVQDERAATVDRKAMLASQ
ncbi:MAG: hypothetical protein MZV70_18480 [Desulfobacterales bacterium]|nr:hypothetical protein [Desulfobacterales bacterium]